MKKVINNKRYDTDTATAVGNWDNGYLANDLHYCAEILYRKRSGEYFVFGEGGAMSPYAARRDGNWQGSGSNIVPLSYDTSRQWGEEHMTGEQYQAEFGAVQEDDSHKTVALSLSVSSIDAAKRAAAKRGISFSGLVDELIKAMDV